MEQVVLCAASSYNKKYYINPSMQKLPEQVKEEVRVVCVSVAEKIHGIFTIGFFEDGTVYMEASKAENDFDYDEIGAGLETERIKREKRELLAALKLWYKVFVLGDKE